MSPFIRCTLFRLLPLALCFTVVLPPALRADSAPDSQKHKPNAKAWKTDKENGEAAYKERKFDEAMEYFKAALAEAENFAADDYRLAESLTELGGVYRDAGKFAEAEPLLHRAADIRHGDPNPLIEASAQFQLGFTSQQLRHFDVAEKAYLRAQELYSRKLGPDHPLAVRCMFHLGALYHDQQDYAKAEALLKRSAALFEHPSSRTFSRAPGDAATHGGVDVSVGRFRPNFTYAMEALVRLGSVYAKENRPAESDASLKEALRLIDDQLAKNDPAAATALGQTAALCLATGNYAGAEPFVQRFVALNQKTKGPEDPVTLFAQSQLAMIYEREGKLPEAEGVYQQLIAEREKINSPDHRALVKNLTDYAALLRKQKRDPEAESLETRAKTLQAETR